MTFDDILAIPNKESPFYIPLAGAIDRCRGELCTVGSAFKSNLEGVADVVTIPYRIGERCLVPEGTEEDGEAVRSAVELAVDKGQLREAVEEVLRQAVVLIWSAFEVLSRDSFVLLLNEDPGMCSAVMRDNSAKKLFPVKFDLDLLESYHFNLSGSMGTILASSRSLDSLENIKRVFFAIFPDDKSLRENLNQDSLRLLNQRRHIIVHRRGLVDEEYCKKSGEDLKVGSKLRVSLEDLREYLTTARDAGIELLGTVNITVNPIPF